MIIYLDKTTYQEFDAWLCNKANKYNFRVSYDQTGYIDDLGDLDRVPKKIYPLRIFLRKIYPNGSVDGKNDGFFIMEKVGERLKVCPKAYEKGVETLKPILKEIADDWPETREIIMRDVFKNNQEIVDKETKRIRQELTQQIQSIGSESLIKRTFKRDGECWHIEYDKENKDIQDSKGMHYIHVLLSRPNKEILSTELYRLGNGLSSEKNSVLGDDNDYLSITEDDDQYPIFDNQYKNELLEKIKK